jgi:hypothetical protein
MEVILEIDAFLLEANAWQDELEYDVINKAVDE